jgi:hypothetical protein
MERKNEILSVFLLDIIVEKRCRNVNNLIQIKTNNFNNVSKQAQLTLPSFYLLNARSLLPKIDELTALISTQPVDIVVVTESWLRKDRATGRGDGICVYIKSDIPCVRRLDLENNRFECLWLCLRPRRLPRPLSGNVICVVYHPPCRSPSIRSQ